MRQRNTGIRSTTGGSGYSGNHLEGHPFLGQQFDFFTATTEDERISTFEAQDTFTFFGQAAPVTR